MYCQECWYDLRGIECRQCPECGRGFHPEIPSTYTSYPGTKLPLEAWAILVLQCTAIVLCILGNVGFWLSDLNRADEYWILGGVLIYGAFLFQLVAVIYGICVAIFQSTSVDSKRRKQLLLITLAPCLIAAGVVVYIWL